MEIFQSMLAWIPSGGEWVVIGLLWLPLILIWALSLWSRKKPDIQMSIGLWGIIALTFLAVRWLFTAIWMVGFINIIFFVVYIFGVIRRRLILAKTAFLVYSILFCIAVVIMLILEIVQSISTPGRWTKIPIVLVAQIIFLAPGTIPIFLMRMGLRGLKRVL